MDQIAQRNRDLRISFFFSGFGRAKARVLLLDYDGTLAPLRKERDQAEPYPGVRERLTQLLDLPGTRVVIITGRWSKHLIPLLGLPRLPEIRGCHGAERVRPDGSVELMKLEERTIRGLAEADQWAESEGLAELLERKPAGLAFHWRGLEQVRVERIKHLLEGYRQSRRTDDRLELHEFDGGMELRTADINKGMVIRSIVQESAPDAAIAYLGDDASDEDAFRALQGRGLRVLVRPEYRDSEADVWIRPPEELLDFLDRWILAGL